MSKARTPRVAPRTRAPAKTRPRRVKKGLPYCNMCHRPCPPHDCVEYEGTVYHTICTQPPLSELEYSNVLRKVIQEEVRNAIAQFLRALKRNETGT